MFFTSEVLLEKKFYTAIDYGANGNILFIRRGRLYE